MKTEIRTDLLRKLADHLINGKLGHEKFDFSTFNEIRLTGLEEKEFLQKVSNKEEFLEKRNYCGTNGCAIGECPIIWPDEWIFGKSYDFLSPALKSKAKEKNYDSFDSAETFFKIEHHQALHLFHAYRQNIEFYGGVVLGTNATKEQVAENIIQFCNLADEGKL